MELVPPEVLELILFDIQDSIDVHCAYNTCALWKKILGPSKTSWIFPQVFRHLFAYLSKSEILLCRLVCKGWGVGVDNFLENNEHNRPALEEDERSGNKYFRSDFRGNYSFQILFSRFEYHPCNLRFPQMRRLIYDSANHPGCRIIGKGVYLDRVGNTDTSFVKEYLKVFGCQIYFLEIHPTSNNPVECVEQVMTALAYTPNLKSLKICKYSPGRVKARDSGVRFPTLKPALKKTMPRLETLKINFEGPLHVKFKNYFFKLFLTKELKTLHFNLIPYLQISKGGNNIVDLSLEFNSNIGLEYLEKMNLPLQKLALTLHGPFNSTTLFQSVQNFKMTLRNLKIVLTDPTLHGKTYPSLEELGMQLEQFSNLRALQDCKSLKRVTLQGMRPLSLNFLCGLNSSLEFLDLSVSFTCENLYKKLAEWINFEEKLDILNSLKRITVRRQYMIYDSNVWQHLPKLRELDVQFSNNEVEVDHKINIVYRRDMYDYLTYLEENPSILDAL